MKEDLKTAQKTKDLLFEIRKDLLEKASKDKFKYYSHAPHRPITILNKIKKRTEEIENEDLEQNIKLKRFTLYALFIFLAVETILIFLYSYFQATKLFRFKLEEWSFKLLIAATISQITYMMQVAVKHLFPQQTKIKKD